MTLPTISPWTLTARWLFPVSQPPLQHGTVTISGDRIVAVEPHGSRTADIDLGNTAILPGLVNAHTHLDLSGLRGKCPPTPDFTGWLRAVIQYRGSQNQTLTPEQLETDIHTGVSESLRFGTTLLGDIDAQGSWRVLREATLRSVVFRELLGLPRWKAWIATDRAKRSLKATRHHPVKITCRDGLSPHAPYSVRDSLYEEAACLANEFHVPIATHLAETTEELELLAHQRGPFVALLSELGLWDPAGLVSSPQRVLQVCGQVEAPVFVHCNYLPPAAGLPLGSTIIYCPRTHAAFGHPPHPFRDFLARGIRVALGTDSLASNPDLDVLAEARFIHQKYPDVPGATVLRMATLSGAEALGWQTETGSLEPGKSADLIVLPLPNEENDDPHRLVLESALPVQKVLWRGNWR